MKKISMENINKSLKLNIDKYGNIFGSLTSNMEVEIFNPGEKIIFYNVPLEKLRFMIQGRAKILFVHEDGKQSIIHFVKKGEYLGELSFLEIEKDPKEVISITESIFVSIDMSLAKKELVKDTQFLFDLSKFIGNKMLERTYFHSKNQNYGLKNRLAGYILMSQSNEIYLEKHTETAEYLGVSYRQLLYIFKEFLDQGVLIKLKKGYKVNIKKLELLAKDTVIA
ncbi:cyclic nucleotide-binding domain-containing protein [Cetobacterium sp.]|uniref:cyclic nucleotide-binding domain-containing protein n=1 Tax=Cetobacterium sp. TaxID=2071632 RepID=UPI003EE5F9DC